MSETDKVTNKVTDDSVAPKHSTVDRCGNRALFELKAIQAKDSKVRLLILSGKDSKVRLLIPSGKDSKVRLLIQSGKDSKVRLLIPSGKDVTIQACHYVFTVKVEQIYRYSVAELFCHV
ncbi:hypothetical protein ACF0H5_021437 [Mactra antiquata]